MGKTRVALSAFALVLCQVAGAHAADLGLPPPPPMIDAAPPPIASDCCTDQGWYFKGFLGSTSYDVSSIDNAAFDTADFTFHNLGFEASGFGGLGFGSKLSPHFRWDATAEYRNRATFHGLDSYEGPGFSGTNDYEATLKSWAMLGNIYWDIVCWNGLTPYVGAGIGFSRNYIGNFTDINVPNLGVAYANTNATTEFAWAIHAGFAFEVNDRVTLDLAYRYINLGDAMSDTVIAYDGSGTADGLEFEDIDSHDVMLGVRWKFDHCCGQAAPMPVAFK
ncbi:hypothetical protein A7A08_01613 [Methyloligella halotolerans]|uniref:Outer membrane protein beta-barrel domain-containing protein n=1 Tax=Methyloligella halotolerans TaxID=1177755 RepID=A0A1E2RZU8_9HYPH|nr:outer membrane beta-barrel protein [Methyloligella halotolerans]ODA67579.1 hypothetical protein A7A08_01613 [Methyloligella halotolerans]